MKLVLIGDACGKTCLTREWLGQPWHNGNAVPTLGVDFKQIADQNGGTPVDVWDTATLSGPRGGLYEGYYIGADALVLMFDVTAPVRNLEMYMARIRTVSQAPVLLVGNKTDLPEEDWSDTGENLLALAEPLGAAGAMLISVKDSDNVWGPLNWARALAQ